MNKPQTTPGREIEVELTFLASAIPQEISGVAPKRMIDVYVPDTATHPHLRLRQKDDHCEVTKKTPLRGNDSSVFEELTIPLDKEEFDALAKSSTKRIAKLRYNVDIQGHPAEVDVFQDELAGLVLIDFEFANEADMAVFVAPKVCLVDVTQSSFIAGGLLAGKTYGDIESQLKELGYNRLG